MRANDHLVYRTKHPIIRRNTRQQPFSILNIRVGKITDLYGEMACTKFSDFFTTLSWSVSYRTFLL